MSSMIKTKNELKEYYEALNEGHEGYVQMSDSRFKDEHLFYGGSKCLPSWDTLHKGINYILEMALYDPKTKKSILIRQHNAGFLVLEKILKGDEPTDSFYTVTPNTPKMQISQIWAEEPSEFCLGMETLEPKYLMFAGFENTKGDKS